MGLVGKIVCFVGAKAGHAAEYVPDKGGIIVLGVGEEVWIIGRKLVGIVMDAVLNTVIVVMGKDIKNALGAGEADM